MNVDTKLQILFWCVGVFLCLAFVLACRYFFKGRVEGQDTGAAPVVVALAEATRNVGMVPHTVAIHNHDFTNPYKEPECQNCNLISMGSMACYEGICPECGQPPPKYGQSDMLTEMSMTSFYKNRATMVKQSSAESPSKRREMATWVSQSSQRSTKKKKDEVTEL